MIITGNKIGRCIYDDISTKVFKKTYYKNIILVNLRLLYISTGTSIISFKFDIRVFKRCFIIYPHQYV